MGYLHGICVWQIPIWNSNVRHVFGKDIIWDAFMEHMYDKYLYGTHMREMYLAIILYRTRI